MQDPQPKTGRALVVFLTLVLCACGGGGGGSGGFLPPSPPPPPPNPTPGIGSLSPSSIVVGAGGFTLTVSGTNFISGSVVRWNVSDRPTTFVGTTQVQAAIAAGDVAAAGTAAVTVFNPAPGGGTSNSVSFTINNPAPALTTVSPASTLVGSADLTLKLTGSGFVSSSKARWDGADRPTTFVSSTELTAAIPASDLALAGTPRVSVFNPSPGGGTSSTVSFTVNNPVPVLTSLNPPNAVAGSGALTLEVTGSNFVSSAAVRWDGADRATTFVSPTRLDAAVLAGDTAVGGTRNVTVFNPAPGGGTSNGVNFTVNNPVPAIISINPSSALTGSGAFTLEVTGSNFVPSSIVRVEGADRVTTFVSPTRLDAAVLAGDTAVGGTRNVTVFNPAPGGGSSAALQLQVNNPVPVLDSIFPTSHTEDGPGFMLTARGSQFVPNSVVRWNGVDRTTTPVSSTELTAAIPAADIVNAGSAQVTVFNPLPGGGTSASREFTIVASGTPISLQFDLFRVDNGVQVPDPDKLTLGTPLSINNDDDDNDGQADNNNLIINGTEDRRDMARLRLNVQPWDTVSGTIQLTANDPALIRVFNENDQPVTLSETLGAVRFGGGALTYYVEGLASGTAVFTFSYDDGVTVTQQQVKLVIGQKVEIFLTFDDGPDSTEPLTDNLTQKVLDTLAQNRVQDGIKATYFVQTHISFRGGNTVGQGQMTAQGAAGHHVEIHTGNGGDPATEVDHALHTDRVLLPPYDVDGDGQADGLNALESDLIRAKARIFDVTGGALTGRTPVLVRPPLGECEIDPRCPATYTRVNLTMQLWDIDSGDTTFCPGDGEITCLLARVRNELYAKIDASDFDLVLLFHDIKPVTANNLDTILKAIEDAIQHRGRNVDFRQF